MNVEDFRALVEKRKSERDLLDRQIGSLEGEISSKKKEVERHVKARWVIVEVARLTQQSFEEYVKRLVTMAIRSVFDRDYKFLVDFEIKANKSECFLRVQEGEWEPFIPKDEQGGGIVDVISNSLQPAMWSLAEPRSRPTIFLDEPLKNMGDLVELGGRMLREISHKAGIQFIINTHDPALVEIADRAFQFAHKNGYSEVKVIRGEGETKFPGEPVNSPSPRAKRRKELEL